ncbi:MAG: ammonia-forming cytochrome c nitrite reductase subunit c552 [candidate division KSB1 bacterium]
MQNVIRKVCLLLTIACISSVQAQTPTYIGSETCQTCHAGAFGNQYTTWNQSLHAKIHLPAIAANIKGDFTKTVSMGASYGNAQVALRADGDKFFARLGASGQEYEIKFTYGGGWKQRYLVKLSDSYYMLPIQWNSKGYLDNSTGDWVVYNPQNWFDATGNPKATSTNSFRAKSWDKNCSGCHITGNNVQRVVAGNDTSYVSTWANNSSVANIVVGCEACHGPASLHPANAFGTDKKIIHPGKFTSNDRKLEACGQCHMRGFSNAGTFEFPWDEATNASYIPGNELAKFIINKPGVWPDGVTARQHHQQYQEFLTSKHSTNPFVPVNCFTCHDPHKAAGDHQMRDSLAVGTDKFKVANDDNTLCLACHATHGPFANITKDMVKDPVANRSAIAAVVSQHTRHSYDPENANSSGGSGRCSKCHLPKTAVTAKSYDIHSHTFDVIPPEKTIFYKDVTTPTVGMLNACATACHRNATGTVAALGVGTDANLTRWNEATDLALADTLMHYYGPDGVWWKRTLTGVADREVAFLPEAYLLQQNYPNPFNPVTVIPFALPQNGKVVLRVFNMLGEEVATVLEQNVPAGKHAVMFDGSRLASGVYFYRLTVNDFVSTKKMIMMK